MRTAFERRSVHLSTLAKQVLDQLRERDPKRAVDCVVQPDLSAFADPVLVQSLLENLIGNAWKYTEKAAAPRIEIGREAGEFYVRDDGAGFDMAYADKLFKPFERLHRADQYHGSGIGLATVERIVRRHGGTVRADARPGEGATFYFTLPGRAG